MDVNCIRCAEPWDISEFHDVADENGQTFDEVRVAFFDIGCAAMSGLTVPTCQRTGSDTALVASMLADMLGDDIDGIAAELEDFEYLYGGEL